MSIVTLYSIMSKAIDNMKNLLHADPNCYVHQSCLEWNDILGGPMNGVFAYQQYFMYNDTYLPPYKQGRYMKHTTKCIGEFGIDESRFKFWTLYHKFNIARVHNLSQWAPTTEPSIHHSSSKVSKWQSNFSQLIAC